MSSTVMPPTLFPDDWSRVRESDSVTSHEAADSTVGVAALSRSLVLGLLKSAGPLADHEIVDVLAPRHSLSPSRIRTARSELVEAGLVRFADAYRLTPSRRRAQVWIAE